MSLAHYIVLDNGEPGFETFVNGKAVAHAADELEALCIQLGLPALSSFMGQSISEIADLLGEDIELPDGEDGAAKWFDPRDGIALIGAVISHIMKNPATMASSDDVLADLEDYMAVLEQAHGISAKWHLAVDF